MTTTTNAIKATTAPAAVTDGWAVIHYLGYHNVPVTRAAFRTNAGWVAAPGQTRPVVGDDRVISVTPMQVAGQDEIIVKAPAPATSAPVRHLTVVS